MEVRFTWFGPPQKENKHVNGIGPARPDLFGLLKTYNQYKKKPLPKVDFILCCLKKYEKQFRNELPLDIRISPIEDVLPYNQSQSLILTRPDLKELDSSVEFIIRETLGVYGEGFADQALPYSKLAFVKDIWSLYAVWKYGGYHIDSGVFPDPKYDDTFNLPEPKGFETPAITGTDRVFQDVTLKFPKSVHGDSSHATLVGAWNTPAIAEASLGSKILKTEKSTLNRGLDIWLLRSTQENPNARAALEFYIKGWFALKTTNFHTNSESLRNLAITSIATGITYSSSGREVDSTNINSKLIEAINGDVPSMGLRKVGFQSHAK